MHATTNAEAQCPLCGSRRYKRLGIRGNREYSGADPNATPHLWTHVVSCKGCAFIYANPAIPEAVALERAYYDDPETYRASFSENHEGMFRSRIEMIRGFAASGALLDVGAG